MHSVLRTWGYVWKIRVSEIRNTLLGSLLEGTLLLGVYILVVPYFHKPPKKGKHETPDSAPLKREPGVAHGTVAGGVLPCLPFWDVRPFSRSP